MREETAKRRFSLDILVKYGVYSIFLVMIVVFSISSKNFLTRSNIVLLLQQAAPLCLGVVGMAFVMMDGGIDISAGSTMYLSAAIGSLFLKRLYDGGIDTSNIGWYIPVMLVAVVVGALMGTFNGFLVSKAKILPFIVTLITTNIGRGLGMYFTNGDIITTSSMGFKFAGKNFLGISVLIYFALAAVLIFHIVMRYTPYGCQLKAQGNNHEAAQKLGINIVRNTWVAYIICGALCGLAGMLTVGMTGSITIVFAEGNEFVIIPAAVLGGISLFGGKGNIFPGAIIGILLTYTIVNVLTMVSANPYVYTIVRGLIIFLAVMVDSLNYKGEIR